MSKPEYQHIVCDLCRRRDWCKEYQFQGTPVVCCSWCALKHGYK